MNLGIPYILSSVICFASLTVLMKKVSGEISTSTIIMVSSGSLFILSLVSFFLFQRIDITHIFERKREFVTLGFVGVLNFAGLYLSILSLEYFSVANQSLFKVLVPVFSAFFAYLILDERIDHKFFIGLSFMAVGLFVATFERS